MNKRTIFGTVILLAVTFGASYQAGAVIVPDDLAAQPWFAWVCVAAIAAAVAALGVIGEAHYRKQHHKKNRRRVAPIAPYNKQANEGVTFTIPSYRHNYYRDDQARG